MKSRTRQRIKVVRVGHVYYRGGNVGQRNVTVFREEMQDSIEKKKDLYGLLPNSALTHVYTRVTPMTLSGRSSGSGRLFTRYSGAAANYSVATGSHISSPSVHTNKDRGNNHYLNLLLAQTNPYNAEYSVPVAFKELIETITLFKIVGDSIIRFGGSAYLNYRFGWKSFERDVKTVVGLVDAIEKRLDEFRSIHKHGGLHRRRRLDSYSTTVSEDNVSFNSSLATQVRGNRTFSYSTKVYGSVRWFPAPGAHHILDDLTPIQEFGRAVRTTLGLEGSWLSGAWEVIPFSWLIDYFQDIGSALAASSGMGIVEPMYVTLTRRTTAKESCRPIDMPSWVRCRGGGRITTRTVRTIHEGNPQVPTALPVITLSEAKVILALLATFSKVKK